MECVTYRHARLRFCLQTEHYPANITLAESDHWQFCTARSVGYGFNALCRLLAQTKTPISHRKSHMVSLYKGFSGGRKSAIVQNTVLLAWQHRQRFCLCCNNQLYLWRLRTTTDQSWFTITLKVPTTKPHWKVNPTCQVPAGHLGIDHFSNESLNNGY